MKNQFIIQEQDINKRKYFYSYIQAKYKLKNNIKNNMIDNTKYPIVIDFNEKSFWLCTSITCCACLYQNNKIISIKDFKERK